MSEKALLALATEQHGLVTLAQAIERGMSSRQISSRVADGRWERVQPKVFRLSGAPERWRQRLMAVCLAEPTALVSHRASGRLWGLEGFTSERVEIVVPPGRARSVAGVKVHECNALLAPDLRAIDGIPVCGPELTLLQLAGLMKPEQVEILLDDAVRRGLTTAARLQWRLRILGRRGRPGSALLRDLFECDVTRRSTQSILERRFLELVRRTRFDDPVAQHPVRAHNRFVARVDFAWPDARVVVELDGERFHSGLRRTAADARRQNELELLGFTVFRFSWWDVHEHANDVIDLLRTALDPDGRTRVLELRPSS